MTAAARAFLAHYVSPAVLEIFHEWQGILIEVPALEGAVWVVHDPQYGRQLANETGKPAILLDAILAQHGQPLEETRAALSPLLIHPRRRDT
jgi:predicted metal-dependent HD superfamily phosphohydrolase